MKTKLLLVDDHAVVRSGLRMLLDGQADVEIVGEAGTASEAIRQVSSLKPDVVLMDLGLPDMSGIDATREIKKLWPEVAVVALTIHEDQEYFFNMLEAGASGYVPKRAAPDELLSAIQVAATGEVYLYPSLAKLLVKDYLQHETAANSDQQNSNNPPPREHEVLTLLADGESNAEIAEKLSISPKTLSRHRENIMQKLNLHSRTELVKYAIRKGIIQP